LTPLAQSIGAALSERARGFERPARVRRRSAAINVANDSLLVHDEGHALRHAEETQNTIEL
jgi:hypothetical protein